MLVEFSSCADYNVKYNHDQSPDLVQRTDTRYWKSTYMNREAEYTSYCFLVCSYILLPKSEKAHLISLPTKLTSNDSAIGCSVRKRSSIALEILATNGKRLKEHIRLSTCS